MQTGALTLDGVTRSPDLVFVKLMDTYIQTYCSYLFHNDSNPFIAAACENRLIDKELLFKDYASITANYECLITDGTAGLETPFAPDFAEKDFVKELNLPVIFVIKPTPSAATAALMAINHAQSENIAVRGVIINDFEEKSCPIEIKALPKLLQQYTDTCLLGTFAHIDNIKNANPNDLIANILSGIDIQKAFNVKIAKLNL